MHYKRVPTLWSIHVVGTRLEPGYGRAMQNHSNSTESVGRTAYSLVHVSQAQGSNNNNNNNNPPSRGKQHQQWTAMDPLTEEHDMPHCNPALGRRRRRLYGNKTLPAPLAQHASSTNPCPTFPCFLCPIYLRESLAWFFGDGPKALFRAQRALRAHQARRTRPRLARLLFPSGAKREIVSLMVTTTATSQQQVALSSSCSHHGLPTRYASPQNDGG
jgi:hypothetical protein